ncbi:MAG TPA: FAD-dependent oxidoreductase [Polyangiaceae bacterium]|jgi:ferredoxin-NADP reductase
MPLPPSFEARLISVRALTPSVRELTFERVDGTPLVFEPGQWVNAMMPIASGEATELKRSYSIASPPDGTPRFSTAVTRVQGGPGSTWLHEAAAGASLRFVGPQGFFTRPVAGAPPSLMVCTGTGVTPMRSMLLAALAAGSRVPVWILLGVRHEEDLVYADELRAAAAANPFVRFEATLSQPRGPWPGRRGYVQAHVRAMWDDLTASVAAAGNVDVDANLDVDASASEPHAYVCGLERMVGSVRELLRKDMGLPRQRVHTERYD